MHISIVSRRALIVDYLGKKIYNTQDNARVSYSGYYLSFPNWWWGFDSPYPLQQILAWLYGLN